MPKNYDQIFQDFEPVILRNKNAHATLAAKRAGNTETMKKPQMSDQQIKMAILDNDNESTKVKFVTKEFSAAMRDARTAKGLKQKDLANRTQLQVVDIQKYENGTATPNQGHISKIQRALGVNLSKLNKK
jgi:ribosome-binding protein aMBF1 (putative translation factor)